MAAARVERAIREGGKKRKASMIVEGKNWTALDLG